MKFGKLELQSNHFFRDAQAFINSEGEFLAWVNGELTDEPDVPAGLRQELDAVYDKCAERYRNWSAARAGEKFSKIDFCVMPNAVIKDGKVFAILNTEFTGTDNKVMPRSEGNGLKAEALRKQLGEWLAGYSEFEGVQLYANPFNGKTFRGYFVIEIVCPADKLESAFNYIELLNRRFEASNQEFRDSHEWIG
jgi:hypothetical protein